MANLSKIKRDKMLAFIDELKAQQTDEKNILMLNNIRNELDGKRYGLVWEEHTEHVDEQLTDNIPVFKEDRSREILSDENLPYNFLLEGDNLHSLKLLEKTHKGKIDVIYIDPPYNTGNKDFVYDDKCIDLNDSFRHSKWLSFMAQRLRIASRLLNKKGSIFVSIDDNEVANLKILCDEIFGDNHLLGIASVAKGTTTGQDAKKFGSSVDYILAYGMENFELFKDELAEKDKKRFNKSDDKGLYSILQFRKTGNGDKREDRPNLFYELVAPDGTKVLPIGPTGYESRWRGDLDFYQRMKNNGFVEWVKTSDGWKPYIKFYLEGRGKAVSNLWNEIEGNKKATIELKQVLGSKVFTNPKPLDLIRKILRITKAATILDFFAGSGTTGHAVMELNKEDGGNRKFILCTNNENNICEDVTYQRLKTVITGKRKDGSKYSEGIPANLKYFKTGWTKRHPEDYFLSHALLLHITEMIELQNAIKVDNKKYVVVLREKDFTNYVANNADRSKIKKLWIREDLILSNEQNKLLQKIKFAYIPREYFSVELQEVGE